MKKRHLLSLLALGISTACYGETYPAPIGPSGDAANLLI